VGDQILDQNIIISHFNIDKTRFEEDGSQRKNIRGRMPRSGSQVQQGHRQGTR